MKERMAKMGETIIRVINKYVENQKKPRKYGVEEQLYSSEIHTIMLIGNNEGMHVSELARNAGVTKGAVSQTVAKLEKKGLVEKCEDPENSSRMFPVLTNKGKIAYYVHEQLHEEMDKELYEYVERLTEDQLGAIEGFFEHLENLMDKRK